MNSSDLKMSKNAIVDVQAILEESRRILVVSHIDPDGDALGTQLAFAAYLRSLGKEVFLVKDVPLPPKYHFLYLADTIGDTSDLPEQLDFDTALVLECPNISRAGNAGRYIDNQIRVVNIDHHTDNEGFGEVNWVLPKASSVGEMAYEYFQTVGFAITPNVAEQLYTAILTDTGRFRFSSTSPRTLEIAGALVAAGANPQKICDEVYFKMPPSTIKLIGKVLNGIEFHHDGLICLLTLTKEMLEESGARASDSDGLVDFTLFSSGVATGALIKEISETETKVSLRAKDGINVAKLAARFGGGGHIKAAGCAISESLDTAKSMILDLLKEAVDEQAR